MRSWKEEEEGELHRSDDGFLTRSNDRNTRSKRSTTPSSCTMHLSLAFCHLPLSLLRCPPYTAAPPLNFFMDYSFSGLFLLEVGGGDS
jgi:hypothetical protein